MTDVELDTCYNKIDKLLKDVLGTSYEDMVWESTLMESATRLKKILKMLAMDIQMPTSFKTLDTAYCTFLVAVWANKFGKLKMRVEDDGNIIFETIKYQQYTCNGSFPPLNVYPSFFIEMIKEIK